MGRHYSVTVPTADAARLEALADNLSVRPQTLIRLMIEEGIERRLGLAEQVRVLRKEDPGPRLSQL